MRWPDILSLGEAKEENGEKRKSKHGKYLPVQYWLPRFEYYLALSDIEALGLGALIGVPWATERSRLRCVIAVGCVLSTSPLYLLFPLLLSLFLCCFAIENTGLNSKHILTDFNGVTTSRREPPT